MASTRELRGHIRSIRSTRQITRAMEMVSAAKLRKASEATVASRPYALRIAEALRDALVVTADSALHALATPRPVSNILLIVITSDRGLAGAYNTAITKEAIDYVADNRDAGRAVSCITIGKKAEQVLSKLGVPILESHPHTPTHPTAADILPIIRSVINRFGSLECDQVTVLSTHFVSSFKHEPRYHQLLPLQHEELVLETSSDTSFTAREQAAEQRDEHVFLTEPSVGTVLDVLIPRYLETILYQLLQDALASEHAARRIAMHNATDNASNLIDRLQLTYNSVRQGTITRELAEITSGTAALEND